MTEGELEKTRNDYIQLSRETAERITRFWLELEEYLDAPFVGPPGPIAELSTIGNG